MAGPAICRPSGVSGAIDMMQGRPLLLPSDLNSSLQPAGERWAAEVHGAAHMQGRPGLAQTERMRTGLWGLQGPTASRREGCVQDTAAACT